jgi:hypothetical protein
MKGGCGIRTPPIPRSRRQADRRSLQNSLYSGLEKPRLVGTIRSTSEQFPTLDCGKGRAAPMSYTGLPKVAPPGLIVKSRSIVDRMNLANQRFD